MMSPPLGVMGRPVAVSMNAISGLVESVPVSLYRTIASILAPVTDVKVTSLAGACARDDAPIHEPAQLARREIQQPGGGVVVEMP